MSKDKSEDSSVGWTYRGVEEDWDGFDRRMIRFMRKKLDFFGERLWIGEIPELDTCLEYTKQSESLSPEKRKN